ncbi:hypothetical protein [Aquimarina megaterium]|uniref:hypothetical protein n=1 Tax=Aquimarina megaterium TaxID=1443666 RepID=UPI0004727D20|nr:hypothetical protein [Aquimarina megaterium]
MKLKLWNVTLIITLFFGCQNEQKLDGNYSMCNNGKYSEIYFKKDSMRVASKNEWVKLSEWRKIEITNNTLYFESFGEWKDNWKAEIKFIDKNKTELHNLITGVKLNLERINKNLNFKNQKEFWEKFRDRQNSGNCK